MEDLDILKYMNDMYLAEKFLDDVEIERYVNECICLSEENFDKFEIISEGAVNKIAEGILRVKNAIIRTFNKFIESTNTLVSRDKGYLEKYKDVILKKKMKDVKMSMHDYPTGVKRIINTKVDPFNHQAMKSDLSSKEQFAKKYFKEIFGNMKEGDSMYDLAKVYFLGSKEPEDVNSESLNMTDLFNYCYGYKDMIKLINKDIDYINKAYDDFLKLINKALKDEKIVEKEKTENNSNTNTKNNTEERVDSDGEVKVNLNSVSYYSQLFNTYLNEVEFTNKASKVKDSGNKESNPNQYNSIDSKNVENKVNEGETAEALKNEALVYFKVCGDVLAAKKSAAEKCYKEYMTIIRYHVRYFIKNENNPNK